MLNDRSRVIEDIQRLIVRLIATCPAGHRLRLIGGFRYRLLDGSCRTSADIDYHWDGDLDAKRSEIAELLTRRLLPEVRRRFGYDGHIRATESPATESPFVKTVTAELYRTGERADRVEIPVEITAIPCADEPTVRTVSGTVYLTASDADMAEGKVVALFGRTYVQPRDLVDLYLFQDQLTVASAGRVQAKLATLGLSPERTAERFRALRRGRNQHVRAINAIIADQVEDAAAANLKAAGGGGMLFDAVVALLADRLKLPGGMAP
jgi:hypothetical protein